jgi:predicted ATP-dependent Lon-type protease
VVKKTVSGLVKLIYPNGQLSKEEVAELVELFLMRASRPLARQRLIEKRSKKRRSFRGLRLHGRAA